MEERKTSMVKEEYLRVVPQIGYYLKNNNLRAIFKHKCVLFAGNIELFTNSLEHMGSLCGHKGSIYCLSSLSNRILG